MPIYPKILDRISEVMEENNFPSKEFVRKMMSLEYTKQNFINYVEEHNLLEEIFESPVMIDIDGLNDSFVQLKITDYNIVETKNDKFLICYDFEILNSKISLDKNSSTNILQFMRSNKSDFVKEHVKTLFVDSFKEKIKDEYYLPFIFSPDVIID
jgi:hypothetical protein